MKPPRAGVGPSARAAGALTFSNGVPTVTASSSRRGTPLGAPSSTLVDADHHLAWLRDAGLAPVVLERLAELDATLWSRSFDPLAHGARPAAVRANSSAPTANSHAALPRRLRPASTKRRSRSFRSGRRPPASTPATARCWRGRSSGSSTSPESVTTTLRSSRASCRSVSSHRSPWRLQCSRC